MKKNLYITFVLISIFLCLYLAILIANNICIYQISIHKEKISKNTEILGNLEKKYNKLKRYIKGYTELFNIYDYLKINFRETNKTLMEVAITIFRESKKNDIDPYLVLSVIKVESSFIADSFSNKGAIGLMQLRPKTAFYIVDKIEDIELSTAHELYDPILNIKIGINYLSYLINKFRYNKKYALIAYNIGPTRLKNMLNNKIKIPERYYNAVKNNYLEIVNFINQKPT